MDTTPQPPQDPPASPPPATVSDGVRFAFGTLTVLPVRGARWDRAAARRGMEWAPLAGAVVGACAAAAGAVALLLGLSPLSAAIVTVAVPAVLTRALHLDGLADVADGLGSGKPAEGALAVMRRSDIGPFGVVALLLVLLAQVAAVAELYVGGLAHGALAVAVAAVTARTAMTLASRKGVPAARPEGLGAAVAGVVPVRSAAVVGAAVVMLAAVVAGVSEGPYRAVSYASAVVLALGAAEALLVRCRRRLGGVTGDVFGALAETALTTTLVVLALG
ncbi:adenosylcobinamide-GDP ribazoletransferase [Streptomyces megasporus]|uniref:adenosylcobinamide-GDP ribazoletransferase n=1 Tax=Streptomyces megasporus TaxID=44060 RepID=UPI0004E13556|nr:adenosylcobinamide-GDP ribazoletransferase [Streptomyces megasporus]